MRQAFETWWDKNEKQFMADSCHMSEFHMAGVVWEAALQSRWQPIETAPKDGTWILVRGFCQMNMDNHCLQW